MLRVLAIIIAAAVASAVLRGVFLKSFAGFAFLKSILVMAVYSSCIAIPTALTLHTFGHRFADRGRNFFIACTVGVLLTANVLGCFAADLILLAAGVLTPDLFWTEFTFAIPFGTVITLMFGLGMAFYEWMRGKMEVEEERAKKLLAEARLSSLESRIHPHFLFNTLNSISSLIPSDPKRAEDMVLKLSSLLRFSLNSNQTKLVPLGQELKSYAIISRSKRLATASVCDTRLTFRTL